MRMLVTNGEGAGMDENMIGFTTKKYVNSPIVQMSFLIYESDLYLLQKSKTWEKFRNFVEETQSKGNRMSLQEKIELLGKEVRQVSFFKDNADKKELKAKTDRVLQHVKDKITKEEYMPDELPELVNAYTELLYARIDLEEM